MGEKIIRTTKRAEGGITEEEKKKMDAISKKWIDIALRTSPTDYKDVEDSITRLYAAADLSKPNIVLVPSPRVMAWAYGISSAVWYLSKNIQNEATYRAIAEATDGATYEVTDEATRGATYGATRRAIAEATREATYRATYRATAGVTDEATREATLGATREATRGATLGAIAEATYRATLGAIAGAIDRATNGATAGATLEATAGATRGAIAEATREATNEATRRATAGVTAGATDGATAGVTDGATNEATNDINKIFDDVARKFVGEKNISFARECSKRWWNNYQGGNMWAGFCSYAEAMRDVLGLTDLDCWEKYKAWEDSSKIGGFRVMHEKFCIVSDFPKTLSVDDRNRAHSTTGPSHEWRDGWKLYYLHGVKFEEQEWRNIVEKKISIKDIMKIPDIDKRTAALMVRGVEELFDELKPKKIDSCAVMRDGNPNPLEYELYEVEELTDQTEKMLRYKCASFDKTGNWYIKWVDPKYTSALEAIADSHHLTKEQYKLTTIKQA